MNLLKAKTEIRQIFLHHFPELRNKVLIATTHHPYSSPPVRLISSTYMLNRYYSDFDIKILYWDYSLPNEVKYREELALDLGLYKTGEHDFIFKPNIFYPFQKPNKPNFTNIMKDFEQVLALITNMSRVQRIKRDSIYINNLLNLFNVYESLDYTQNGTLWSIQLLSKQLELCDFYEESQFLTTHSDSALLNIPFKSFLMDCFTHLHDTEFDVFTALQQIYPGKPVFISIQEDNELLISLNGKNIVDQFDHKYSFNELLEFFSRGDLVPGQFVIPYIFYLANIYEFGKDYGSHDIISKHYEQSLSPLHITDIDYIPTLAFAKGITYAKLEGKLQKITAQKLSRLNTINALYIHMGQNMGNMLHEIIDNKSPELKILMGESFYA